MHTLRVPARSRRREFFTRVSLVAVYRGEWIWKWFHVKHRKSSALRLGEARVSEVPSCQAGAHECSGGRHRSHRGRTARIQSLRSSDPAGTVSTCCVTKLSRKDYTRPRDSPRRFHVKHVLLVDELDALSESRGTRRPASASLSCWLDTSSWCSRPISESTSQGSRTPSAAVRLHTADSLTVLPEVQSAPQGPLLDSGFGGRIPRHPSRRVHDQTGHASWTLSARRCAN